MSRYLRTPKGGLVLVLAALIALAYPFDGQAALARLAAAIAAALLTEAIFMYAQGKHCLPDGAVLTGVIVAMVLSQDVPIGVPILASAAAITSKHLLRLKQGHIFNPAAFGLLFVGVAMASEQSWWGGLGDAPPILILAVIGLGLFIARRVNKLPAILAFLGVYFGLLTVGVLAGNPLSFADAFREPMSGAAMFFAFFMLTDPPTTPARPSDQVWFACVAAAVSALCLALNFAGAYGLLVGLLAANAIEAARRNLRVRRRTPAIPRPVARDSIALG